ncbi:lymphocyte function-associated antigen 3 isoform X2 [Oryzias latipes]
MLVAASEGQKTFLKAVVGGNVTLPESIPEEGFLLRESTNLAQVLETKLRIIREPYKNRILWDQSSGLFTITDLQRSDSGLYSIDSNNKKDVVFYNLTVFDSVAPPAVQRLNSSSDGCWLLCSVDKHSSLSWFKGQEKLERRDSVLSLNVSIPKEDLDASFRCESSNLAENRSQTVEVKTLCSHVISEESTRLRWAAIGISIAMIVVITALVVCLIKWKLRLRRRNSRRGLGSEDSVQYTAIQFQDRNMQRTTSDMQDASHLATVYGVLKKDHMDLTEPSHPTTVYDQLQSHRMDLTEASHLATVYDHLQKDHMDPTEAPQSATVYDQLQSHRMDRTGPAE